MSSEGVTIARPMVLAAPLAIGAAGALAMLAVSLTIVSLVQGWDQGVQTFWKDGYLIAPLVVSFGVQVGLYTYLRGIVRTRTRADGAVAGASGATSTAAMVACCAHRVADLLPFLGLSAAAGFLAAYRIPFLIVGLAFSLTGVAFMALRIRAYKAHHMRRKVA